MSFLQRRLEEAISQLDDREKLYAAYALFEDVPHDEIGRLLNLDGERLDNLQRETLRSLLTWVRVPIREIGFVRRNAERALRHRLHEHTGDPLDRAGRLTTDEHIVVGSVSARARELSLDDVRRGDGGELRQPRALDLHPRFHSFRSSCALAVNAFGFWREHPSTLDVAGLTGFSSLSFEEKFPIEGSERPYAPNLDVYAVSENGCVAVESKMLEYLSVAKPVSIEDAYDHAIKSYADPSWKAQIERLRAKPLEFTFFAAGQIVKHYLGLKSAKLESVRLIYLYWEPLDRAEHRLFAHHRAEVEDFASSVRDDNIALVPIAYSSLLEAWEGYGGKIRKHVGRVRERYDVSIFAE